MIVPEVGSRNRSDVGSQPGRAAAACACRRRIRLRAAWPGAAAAPGAAAPSGGRSRTAAARRGLVRIVRGQHDLHPAGKLVDIDPAQRVMLAQHDSQPVPVSITKMGNGHGRRAIRHGQAASVGRATTAMP